MELIKVLLVDDHPLFAEALAARLDGEPDLVVLPVARDAGQAAVLVDAERPTVVVLDLALGAESGLDVLDRIRLDAPGTRVVMLTEVRDVAQVEHAVRRGANAWLQKTASVDELVTVIRRVVRGDGWIPPELLGELLRRLTAPEHDVPDPFASFTAREREVLQYLVDGLSRAEIAARMYVSANTVRTHTQNLLQKIGGHSVLEAVSLAMRAGLRPTSS